MIFHKTIVYPIWLVPERSDSGACVGERVSVREVCPKSIKRNIIKSDSDELVSEIKIKTTKVTR